MINAVLQDSPEKSIFHTSEPRDTKTKIHLALVFICLMSALMIAIVFAETKGNIPVADQGSLREEKTAAIESSR